MKCRRREIHCQFLSYGEAMFHLRYLATALVAGLVSGCGVSSVTDVGLDSPKLGHGSSHANLANAGTANSALDGAAAASTPAQPEAVKQSVNALTSVATPGSMAYKIGPLDVVDVSVFKVPELSKTVQLSEAGTMNYPLVGELNVAGMTAREVEQRLTKMLGEKYLRNPQVTVFVKEHNSQRITIEGTVKKPGVYPIKGGMSLLQAVAMAQGMDAAVSDNTLVVFRNDQGKRSAAKFNVAELRSGKVADPQLQAGDVVVANPSAIKQGFEFVLKSLRLTSVFALL